MRKEYKLQMRCCASPTTSTAANGGAPALAAAGFAANAIQAVLFSEILKPLSAALGPVGDVALAAATQGLFLPARR